MKSAFSHAHRDVFGVRTMCRMLRVHLSGVYAWLREPVSTRAKEDVRQTALLRDAWSDSGKVCGYPSAGRALQSKVPRGASCTTICGIQVRCARRTGSHGLRALQGSPLRSETGGVPDGMEARPRSLRRTCWTASLKLMRPIRHG